MRTFSVGLSGRIGRACALALLGSPALALASGVAPHHTTYTPVGAATHHVTPVMSPVRNHEAPVRPVALAAAGPEIQRLRSARVHALKAAPWETLAVGRTPVIEHPRAFAPARAEAALTERRAPATGGRRGSARFPIVHVKS